MARQVITVLGPVAPELLGVTDAHNHLWISPVPGRDGGGLVLDQMAPITRELIAYREHGGGTQLDCQPGGAGRDGNRLRQLSEDSGVKIVASTGFHLSEYYPEDAEIWNMNAEQAGEYFLEEITRGLAETRNKIQPVYPGFIKIAVRETLSKTPLELLEGAVEAGKQSGYLLEMHTEKGQGVEAFVEFFENSKLPLERVVLCHVDKRPDFGLHQELASAGCLLEYDTFFRPKYSPEKNLWPLLHRMVEDGWSGSVACATDLADSKMWQTMGQGPGLTGFLTLIWQRLEREIGEEAAEKLTGRNIRHRLAVDFKERAS